MWAEGGFPIPWSPSSPETGTRRGLSPPKPIVEVSLLFLKLGCTAFGGPAAYIAMMRDEVVQRRRWIDDQGFLDLVGATNLIPGPNATEMAIHIGLLRAGWRGLLAAGALFILPGALLTLILAWVYVEYGALPQTGWVLYGVKPAVIAIVLQALWHLGRTGVRTPFTAMVGTGVVVLYLLGVNEIALLFSGAALVMLARAPRRFWTRGVPAAVALPLLWKASLGGLAAVAVPFSTGILFLTFLKIGSVLYGSGYVLMAFLRSDFVDRLGWLTPQQLLDAIAVGQVTPGPVFTSATFVGYLVGGWPSALLSTLAIFLPSFIFVALLSRFLPLLRNSPWAGAFLNGANAASLGLMAGVTWQLGREALVDVFAIALLLAALLLSFRFKANPAGLVLGGGLIGLAYKMAAG